MPRPVNRGVRRLGEVIRPLVNGFPDQSGRRLFAEEAGRVSDDRVAQERELSVLLARALAGHSEATEELLIFEREHG